MGICTEYWYPVYQKQMFQNEEREVLFQNEGRWQYNVVTEIIENVVSY